MTPNKPKLLFFQSSSPKTLPQFLLIHQREQVQCLAEFFDVVVVNRDCDYIEVCDTHKPDLAVFELGVNNLMCRRPAIRNVGGSKEIPKIGLLNADAWCETRAGIVSNLCEYGIKTVFSISTTAGVHLTGVEIDLYYWPVFVDPQVYRDYHERKAIPIFLTGSTHAQYPWRRQVFPKLATTYPCLAWPHPGYLGQSAKAPVIYGEDYARTLNASSLVPTCGTVALEVVRKHFEIPACRGCLLTERSPGLEAAGFRDLENCIFADDNDVMEKVDFLFSNREKLREITDAGYTLVQERHCMNQRKQIFQWFTLRKSLSKNQTLIQRNPFGPIEVASANEPAQISKDATLRPLHLSLISQADAALAKGDYTAAERAYEDCLTYMQLLPEARLGQAICRLYKGDAEQAHKVLFDLVEYTVSDYKAATPDPIEWSYYLISLLCLGKVQAAGDANREFAELSHLELERVRIAMAVLGQKQEKPYGAVTRGSFHKVPARSISEWVNQLCTMLRCCGQIQIAELLEHNLKCGIIQTLSDNLVNTAVNSSLPVARRRFLGYFQRRVFLHKLSRKLVRSMEGMKLATIGTSKRSAS